VLRVRHQDEACRRLPRLRILRHHERLLLGVRRHGAALLTDTELQ
jgi:hypothetical protein